MANPNPTYCSSCFAQQPTKKHVDFEVAWDGPVISHESGLRLQIDDLFICEDCLRSAAGLLGMVYEDDPDLRKQLENVLDKMQIVTTENGRLKKEKTKIEKELAPYKKREEVFTQAFEALDQAVHS